MSSTVQSDSDDDLDYVPPADDSDSADDDRLDATAPDAQPQEDPAEQKKRRDALWATFQASMSSSTPSTSKGDRPTVNRVQVEKTYLFAGKHVTEVVEVPEDSEEARKWPQWVPDARPMTEATVPSSAPLDKDTTVASSAPPPPDMVPSTSTPAPKRPGPRKPRTTLPSLPSKSSQAKKITTLDKSAMDWRTHIATQSSNVKDQLETNRRGGGYLDKVDFLRRVQDRREDTLEANKPNKRRKI